MGIHPDTGAANKLKFSKEKQQQWALDYERQQGEILCRQREAHDAQRQAEAQRRQEARDQGQDPGKAQYARYDDHENYWDREAYEAEFQKAVVDAAIEQEEQRQAQEARAQAEARRQAERSAAETRLNRRLAALQSAHFDARQALDDRLARQQHATREAVENQYRFSIRQNQATIADLEAKLDQGGLSGWLYRLQHGEDARERLEAARQSLGNAEMRQAEARQALDRQAEAERQQLLQTQARERAALEQELSLLRARQAARDQQQEKPSAQRRAEARPAFNQQAANQNVPPAPQQEVRPAFNQQAAANQNDPPGQQETAQPDRQQGVQGGHGPQKNLER